jgi:transposase-like protein
MFQIKALKEKLQQLKEENDALKQALHEANLARQKVRQLCLL